MRATPAENRVARGLGGWPTVGVRPAEARDPVLESSLSNAGAPERPSATSEILSNEGTLVIISPHPHA